MLIAALLAAAQPAPPPRAGAPVRVSAVRVSARILRPVRVVDGRPDARRVTLTRRRPGLVLIEFQ